MLRVAFLGMVSLQLLPRECMLVVEPYRIILLIGISSIIFCMKLNGQW